MTLVSRAALSSTAAAIVLLTLGNPAALRTADGTRPGATPASSVSPPQFRIVPGSLPEGADGVFYSTVLSAESGYPACGWFIQGPLPDGLQLKGGLTCQAQIFGTPDKTDHGRYRFSVQAYDNIGDEASASLSIDIREHLPVPAPARRAASPLPGAHVVVHKTQTTPDWSGYVVAGRSFSAVSGTFTVPYIRTRTAGCAEQLAVWDGLDGAGTVPGGTRSTLLQAGIAESMTNPLNGECTPGEFYVWPWWEIFPAPQVPIFTMNVNVEDRVTVRIWKTAGSRWAISLHDETNGQSFTAYKDYPGPATTAEWIVEASQLPGLCASGVDSKMATGICQLAPYTPEVVFGGLGVDGSQKSLENQKFWQLDMVQDGTEVAVPSELAGDGFSIAYTGGDRRPSYSPLRQPL